MTTPVPISSIQISNDSDIEQFYSFNSANQYLLEVFSKSVLSGFLVKVFYVDDFEHAFEAPVNSESRFLLLQSKSDNFLKVLAQKYSSVFDDDKQYPLEDIDSEPLYMTARSSDPSVPPKQIKVGQTLINKLKETSRSLNIQLLSATEKEVIYSTPSELEAYKLAYFYRIAYVVNVKKETETYIITVKTKQCPEKN